MSKPLKSQWEFPELFPLNTGRRVYSVSELTTYIRQLLEKHLGTIWISGEITNFRLQSSGHAYFTLKDQSAQVACVLFRGDARSVDRQSLRDGEHVILQGELTVYEARGQYQLRVLSVELQGLGALHAAFEKLKQKLQAEGLFAPERKRPVPPFPQRIGIVTSSSGAALHDVLRVIERRNPALEIILSACRVQGQGAAEEIACAIRLLNSWHAEAPDDPKRQIDLILVTRGGGSLQDLWAFNEEVVARAIFDSHLPVVSGVGHEIDFTICDFVADFRASTPSAAAEIITESAFACREFVRESSEHLSWMVRKNLLRKTEEFARYSDRLTRVHPQKWLHARLQRLDDLETTLFRSAKYQWRDYFNRWERIQARLGRTRPSHVLEQRRKLLHTHAGSLQALAQLSIANIQNRLESLQSKLRLLSPTNVLERGYSITTDAATGKVLCNAAETKAGQILNTRLRKGEIKSVIVEI